MCIPYKMIVTNVTSLAKQNTQQSDQEALRLRQEVETLRTSKIDVERRFNEMEQSLRVCESQSQSNNIAGAGSLQQQQRASNQQVRELYTVIDSTCTFKASLYVEVSKQ